MASTTANDDVDSKPSSPATALTKLPLIWPRSEYTSLLVSILAFWIVFVPTFRWLIGLSVALAIVLTGHLVVRKLLADYAHFHYEDVRFLWREWLCWSVEMRNVVVWAVWYEYPDADGGKSRPVDVPLEKIYKPLPHLRTDLSSFQNRMRLERWPERNRLQLSCAGLVRVELDWQRRHWFRVWVEDARVYNPQESPDIHAEQRHIFPQGYPNFIEPVFTAYQWARWLLLPVIRLLLPVLEINISQVEVHGIPNPGFYQQPATPPSNADVPPPLQPRRKSFGTGLRSRMSVLAPLRDLVRDAADAWNLKPRAARRSSDMANLTATIHHITVMMANKPNGLHVDMKGLAVFEGNNYVLKHSEDVAIMAINGVTAEVCVLGLSTNDCDTKQPGTILLAEPRVLSNRSVKIRVMMNLRPPYYLHSDFVTNVLEAANADMLGRLEDESALLAKVTPLIGLCFEDTGLANATRSITANVVAGVARNARSINWDDDLKLMW